MLLLLSQLLHLPCLGGCSKANIARPENLPGLVLSILPHTLRALPHIIVTTLCGKYFYAFSFIDGETGSERLSLALRLHTAE